MKVFKFCTKVDNRSLSCLRTQTEIEIIETDLKEGSFDLILSADKKNKEK